MSDLLDPKGNAIQLLAYKIHVLLRPPYAAIAAIGTLVCGIALTSLAARGADAILITACLLSVTLVANAFPKRCEVILFGGCCVTIMLITNWMVFGLIRPPLTWWPDSGGYIAWPPDPQRMPLIDVLYTLFHQLLGYPGLLALQVNLVLLAYLAALACLAHATQRYWPFIPMTILPWFWGNFLVYATAVASEPWFIAGALLGAAGVVAIVRGGRRFNASIAAFGLLLAVISKAVGMVLVVPAIIAYRFIPGERRYRLKLVAIIIAPAILAYLGMMTYGRFTYGRWSPHVVGGYSLVGYVAWMLDADDLPPEYREAGRQAVDRLRQLYSQMPAMTEPNQYVDFAAVKYNEGLYGIIVPTLENRVQELMPRDNLPNTAVSTMANDLFGSWARAAIWRHPFRYLSHCMLNFWGVWRDGLVRQVSLGLVAKETFLYGFQEQHGAREDYRLYLEDWQRRNESRALTVKQYGILSVASLSSAQKLAALALMMIGLALSFLYLFPKRLIQGIAPLIVCVLFINSYCAGHALFQVSLVRYGEAIAPLLLLLIGLAVAHLGAARAKSPQSGRKASALMRSVRRAD
jgi:hypothetical protein